MPKIEDKLKKLINRAIYDYKLIEDGDRLLVGFSGGKDSITALYGLLERQKIKPSLNFELAVLHVTTDLSEKSHLENVIKFLESLNVKYFIENASVIGELQDGKSVNCYWCARLRRKYILKAANDHGYNKIVLGHNQDDIIETFLINTFYKAELNTIKIFHKYDIFPYSIIRPLCLVKEDMIEKFVQKMGFPIVSQVCPYAKKTKRQEIKNLIDMM
ncbi:MAG TPA: ATP-binding protein, partial [Spirochaetota bacterium]|nr:ATP-binding protein [Spirochaetota bacterium]